MDNLQNTKFIKYFEQLELTISNHVKLLKLSKELYDDFECEILIDSESENYKVMRQIMTKQTISSALMIEVTDLLKKIK